MSYNLDPDQARQFDCKGYQQMTKIWPSTKLQIMVVQNGVGSAVAQW